MKNNIKRVLSVLLALTMCFAMSATAFAVAPETANSCETAAESENNQIQPRGSLSGYGQHWYNSGEPTNGSFTVNVSGIAWPTAKLTLNIVNFDAKTFAFIWVYRPDGSLAYSTGDATADAITVANSSKYQNIIFPRGQTGPYTVVYSLGSYGGTVPSGRINCWIF